MTVVILLLLSLLMLLAVPVNICYAIKYTPPLTGYVDARWLFGMVRIHKDLSKQHKAKQPHKRTKPKHRRQSKSERLNVMAMLKRLAFRQRLQRFLGDMLRATHARNFHLRLRIGTGDPSDTGILWAFLGPVNGVAQALANGHIHIEADFIEPIVEFESHGKFQLIPIQFLFLVVTFLVSPAVLSAAIAANRGAR